MHRLGVVSFLNARPLIEGLSQRADIRMRLDVPAALPALLDQGEVDAALIPVIDTLRNPGRYRIISDACIGCDGETMTVRVFSQVPPDRITRLRVDPDSHTSVALATVLWNALYGRRLVLDPLADPACGPDEEADSILLIGDKVVSPHRGRFAYEVDLGGAWRQHTGLPFVFAVWAVAGTTDPGPLPAILAAARDRGVAQADAIARTLGPELGWEPGAARRYLTRCLRYHLDGRAVEGIQRFARYCAAMELVPPTASVPWEGPEVPVANATP